MQKWQRKMLQMDGKRIAIWPSKPSLAETGDKSIFSVLFDYIEYYHSLLQQVVLER